MLFIVVATLALLVAYGCGSAKDSILSAIQIIVSAINVCVFAFLTGVMIDNQKKSNENAQKIGNRTVSVALYGSRIEKMRKNLSNQWLRFINCVPENDQISGNQQFFDNFYSNIKGYVDSFSILTPEVRELRSVKWWEQKNLELQNYYRTNQNYDFGSDSYEMGQQVHQLVDEIVECVMNRKYS